MIQKYNIPINQMVPKDVKRPHMTSKHLKQPLSRLLTLQVKLTPRMSLKLLIVLKA